MNIGPLVAIVPVVLAVAMIILIIRRNVTGRSESISRDITAAIPAIVVLMVAALLIGSFASTVDKNTYELYDCVPLSEFGSDATIDGDCAEVVTIGGEQYVRMTSLGTFTASSGSQTKDYNVVKAHMDLVLIAGQSNCYFFTAPSLYDGPTTVAPGKAFYLGSGQPTDGFAGIPREEVSGSLDSSAIMDYVASDGSVNVAGMYPSFCGGYVSETGHRVLVVNTAIGGQGIDRWVPGQRCDVWMHDVLDHLKDIVSDGSVVLNPTVALWSQGEADVARSVSWYEERMVPLLQRLWGGDYGYSFENVLSVLPRHATYTNPVNPAIAQEEIASEYEHFVIASTLPVNFTSSQMRDGAHYTQEAYGWLGEAFARSAAEVLGDTPSPETLVLPVEVGAVETLPAQAGVYGTSGELYTVASRWSATSDPSVYTASYSRAPSGTVIASGLSSEAYPCKPSLFTYDDTGSTITGLSSAGAGATHLVIPTAYDGKSISWIGNAAFQDNTTVTHLMMLPDSGLLGVSASAFRGCTSLKEADVPESCYVFGNYAFTGCSSLESFEIPAAAGTLSLKMFENCVSLGSVNIPSTVTQVTKDAFQGCTGTTEVSFGTGFAATLQENCFGAWTFYASDGTTVIDKTDASNLAGNTFKGTASALVMQS